MVIERPLSAESPEPGPDLAVRDFAVVLTQECDLEQDHMQRLGQGGESTHDKRLNEALLAVAMPTRGRLRRARIHELPSILLAAAIDACKARATTVAPKKPWFPTDDWKKVAQNKNERYQILEAEPGIHDGLLVDFKQVFSVSTEYLYSVLALSPGSFLCSMSVPYREHLSSRFASFLSRVALPRDHSDPVAQAKAREETQKREKTRP